MDFFGSKFSLSFFSSNFFSKNNPGTLLLKLVEECEREQEDLSRRKSSLQREFKLAQRPKTSNQDKKGPIEIIDQAKRQQQLQNALPTEESSASPKPHPRIRRMRSQGDLSHKNTPRADTDPRTSSRSPHPSRTVSLQPIRPAINLKLISEVLKPISPTLVPNPSKPEKNQKKEDSEAYLSPAFQPGAQKTPSNQQDSSNPPNTKAKTLRKISLRTSNMSSFVGRISKIDQKVEHTELLSNKSMFENQEMNPTSIENWHHIVTPPRHPGLFYMATLNYSPQKTVFHQKDRPQTKKPLIQNPQINEFNSPSLDQMAFQKRMEKPQRVEMISPKPKIEKKLKKKVIRSSKPSTAKNLVNNFMVDQKTVGGTAKTSVYLKDSGLNSRFSQKTHIRQLSNGNRVGSFEASKTTFLDDLNRYSMQAELNAPKTLQKVAEKILSSHEKKIRIQCRSDRKDPNETFMGYFATPNELSVKKTASKIKKNVRKGKSVVVRSIEKSAKKKLLELIKNGFAPPATQQIRSFLKKSSRQRDLESGLPKPEKSNIRPDYVRKKVLGGAGNQKFKRRVQRSARVQTKKPRSNRAIKQDFKGLVKRFSHYPSCEAGIGLPFNSPRNLSPGLPKTSKFVAEELSHRSRSQKKPQRGNLSALKPSSTRNSPGIQFRSFDQKFEEMTRREVEEEDNLVIRELSQDWGVRPKTQTNKIVKNQQISYLEGSPAAARLKLHLTSRKHSRSQKQDLRSYVYKNSTTEQPSAAKESLVAKPALNLSMEPKKYIRRRGVQRSFCSSEKSDQNNHHSTEPPLFGLETHKSARKGEKGIKRPLSRQEGVRKASVVVNAFSPDKVNLGDSGRKRGRFGFLSSRNESGNKNSVDYCWYRVNYHVDRKVVNQTLKGIERTSSRRF